MLNAHEATLLARAAKALLDTDPALSRQLLDAILSTEQQRAAMSKAQVARRIGTAGRPPAAVYTVDFDGHWTITVIGAKATLALITETLTKHGYKNTPSLSSFSVALSRTGTWLKLLETDTGTWALSATRQVSAEAPASPIGASEPA